MPYHKPVIFTTALHEYTLDAFQYFVIDYLVTPVTLSALKAALDKLRAIQYPEVRTHHDLFTGYDTFIHESYKERFLIQIGQKFVFVKAGEIELFKSEGKVVFLTDKKGNKFSIDYMLEKLETLLDPRLFFRLNGKVIISINSTTQVRPFTNKRLQLHLQNNVTSPALVVSRQRVADFHTWAEQ
ncbi:MAG: LytTR family transcriptional regulator DNA-binding domain-containing protein [Williamsia sp.]|nr:LytTR family transcriptional regulator DNA-binding domain-containing protein [Williamsia sp.]